MKKIDLSIIIVTYNSESTIKQCIESVFKDAKGINLEIIISDNSPNEETKKAIDLDRWEKHNLTYIKNDENKGFSKANNIAIKKANGEFVLFLNPDVILDEKTLEGMLSFIKNTKDAGAATCRVNLINGKLDDSCHRGFPTPWRAFCHFSYLSKIFPNSKMFSGYNMTYLNLNKTHEIDALAGSFMMMPFEVGQRLNWWDEDFFFYGEDLDFCYRIKELGLKIYFVPEYKALHYKGISSGIKKISHKYSTVSRETKKWATEQRFKAMEIFYKKHYQKKYPAFMTALVLSGIKLRKILTEIKIYK